MMETMCSKCPASSTASICLWPARFALRSLLLVQVVCTIAWCNLVVPLDMFLPSYSVVHLTPFFFTPHTPPSLTPLTPTFLPFSLLQPSHSSTLLLSSLSSPLLPSPPLSSPLLPSRHSQHQETLTLTCYSFCSTWMGRRGRHSSSHTPSTNTGRYVIPVPYVGHSLIPPLPYSFAPPLPSSDCTPCRDAYVRWIWSEGAMLLSPSLQAATKGQLRNRSILFPWSLRRAERPL